MKRFFLIFTIVFHGISLSLPFILVDGYNQLDIRFMGVPIIYLLSAFFLIPLTIILFSNFRLINNIWINIYFFLIFISSLVADNISESISFWVILIFEVYVVFLIVEYLPKIDIYSLKLVGKYFVITHIFVSLVGFSRYFFGIAYDTSPFPEMNRNLSLLVYFNSLMIIDLLSYQGIVLKNKRNIIFFISLLIIVVAGQRSFIVAFALIVIAKFLKRDFGFNILIMCGVALIFALFSGLLDYSIERFSGLALYADSTVDFDKIENDKDRIFMVLDSFEIWSKNKLLGVGFGTDNYAYQHGKYWVNTPRASLPHNLFVSLLTQNGILAYCIFLLFSLTVSLKMIFRSYLGKIRVGAIVIAYFSIYFSNQYIFYPLLFFMYGVIYYLIMNVKYEKNEKIL